MYYYIQRRKASFSGAQRALPSDEWLATLDGSPQKTAAGALRGLL
jgi:hypothetical protein